MTKNELLEKLKQLQQSDDIEVTHIQADMLLLMYINDIDISTEFYKIRKYYA